MSILKVQVHDSAIKRRLDKYGLFGKDVRRKPLLLKKKTRTRFQKLHLSKQLWKNVLQTDENKVELSDINAMSSSVTEIFWKQT